MAERLIHILPEQVASRIAAGEVVERPASAVKELVENSLDAGAHSVEVEIERGGLGLIAVVDDGCGMSGDDARVSLRRHATSKIRDAGDLNGIKTLGFRGEALASIASVAHLRLKTYRPGDPHGVELSAVGGNIESERACAMAAGTQVEARELFFNTPARLKFMKTPASEQGAVAEVVQRVALANPSVAFSLRADGRALFALARAASVLERARQVFGPVLAGKLLGFSGGRDKLSVSGLATMSQESFASARMLFTFVNGRPVRDRLLLRAVQQAYQTLLPRGRHPAVVLFLEVRPEDVDVNVHPMKTEVRFRSPGPVFELVYHALRDRLANQSDALPVMASSTQDAAAAPAKPPGDTVRVTGEPVAAFMKRPAPAPAGDEPERPLRLVIETPDKGVEQRALGLGFNRTAGANGTGVVQPAAPMYSELKMLGQVFAGYIALENDDGLVLIDQHAAHERVTFEKLRAELRNGGIRTQAILAPAVIELGPARAGHAEAALPALRAMGFDVEQFGPAAFRLKGVPAVFGPDAGVKLLSDMIESMGEGGTRLAGEAAFEDLLKKLACHGSVRVGRVLEQREIRELLAELDRTEFKTNCPHGRPVHISFGRGQIERMFRR